MQRGSLKVVKNRQGVKQWRFQWRENGSGRTRLLGPYAEMSRSQAAAEGAKILAPLNTRQATQQTSATTLRVYTEKEYLTVKNTVWKASTRYTTEHLIENYLLRALGSRPLILLTRKELQAHLDGLAGVDLSFSVVAHVRWQLVAIFEMAQGDGLITVNPTNGLVTPKCKAAPDKQTISVADLLRAQMVLDIRERLIFRLAMCEGMRPGEIAGLRVGDFREDGIFYIERRIYRTNIDTPKSKRSRRRVPPTEVTRTLLAQWLNLLGNPPADAWLFASEAGATPISYPNVYRRNIQPALESIGLGTVNFQVLRRSWVTEFSQAESDPNVRAQLAGHGVDVHENEYSQPRVDVLRRAMDKLDKRLQ